MSFFSLIPSRPVHAHEHGRCVSHPLRQAQAEWRHGMWLLDGISLALRKGVIERLLRSYFLEMVPDSALD